MEKKLVNRCIFALIGILVTSTATPGERRFDHVKYLEPRTKEQKSQGHPASGSVVFDKDKKTVEFLGKNGDSVVSIRTEEITKMLVDDKPPRLYRPWLEYLLTIEYTDNEKTHRSVAIILNKHNLRDVLMAAAAETGKEVFHVGACCMF
jgi:hypothetical protein